MCKVISYSICRSVNVLARECVSEEQNGVEGRQDGVDYRQNGVGNDGLKVCAQNFGENSYLGVRIRSILHRYRILEKAYAQKYGNNSGKTLRVKIVNLFSNCNVCAKNYSCNSSASSTCAQNFDVKFKMAYRVKIFYASTEKSVSNHIRVLTTSAQTYKNNSRNTISNSKRRAIYDQPNELTIYLKNSLVTFKLFRFVVSDFDVNPLRDNLKNLRNFDICHVKNICERAYKCVCNLEIGKKVRKSYDNSLNPLKSSTDFFKLFNFNHMSSQLKRIDCNYFTIIINNLISLIIFIFNFRLFRQPSITYSMVSMICRSVQVRKNKECCEKRFDTMEVTFGALKCCTAIENVRLSIVGQRHFKGPANHFGNPIVLSKKICLPVISYIYYNFIIKNVIPKIDLKFLRTSVIVMPFYLIFYPLSGFYSDLSFDNSYFAHSFQNGRMFLL